MILWSTSYTPEIWHRYQKKMGFLNVSPFKYSITILGIYVKLPGGYTVTPLRFKVASENSHVKIPLLPRLTSRIERSDPNAPGKQPIRRKQPTNQQTSIRMVNKNKKCLLKHIVTMVDWKRMKISQEEHDSTKNCCTMLYLPSQDWDWDFQVILTSPKTLNHGGGLLLFRRRASKPQASKVATVLPNESVGLL